jgi:hypothetical protein
MRRENPERQRSGARQDEELELWSGVPNLIGHESNLLRSRKTVFFRVS